MTVHFSKSVNTKAWLQINELSQIASPSKAYFSISTRCCWKAKTSWGFSWESKHYTFIHTYEQTYTQTGKQTHVCANTIQKVRVRALIDTHRSCWLRIFLRFKLHSLVCSAAYSCRFCMCLPHCCLCQPVCLVGESVRGCFCSHDMSVCFGESLCLACTLSGADTLSDVFILWIINSHER